MDYKGALRGNPGCPFLLELIMDRTPWWQRIIAIALLPVLIPAAAIVGLFFKPIRRTPEEVESFLSDFIAGVGQPYDWDDFTTIPIADPGLEAIRSRAADIKLPGTAEGSATLEQLLAEVQTLQRTPS
jgi:hypothetical protein